MEFTRSIANSNKLACKRCPQNHTKQAAFFTAHECCPVKTLGKLGKRRLSRNRATATERWCRIAVGSMLGQRCLGGLASDPISCIHEERLETQSPTFQRQSERGQTNSAKVITWNFRPIILWLVQTGCRALLAQLLSNKSGCFDLPSFT